MMNPRVHSTGEVSSRLPRKMVNSQLNTFTPVGMAMIIVMMPKKAFTLAPAPMVKKWCNQTMNDSSVIATVAQTMVL